MNQLAEIGSLRQPGKTASLQFGEFPTFRPSPTDSPIWVPFELMSLFRGSSLGTHCSGGSCLSGFSLEAGASSALRSRAGALERGLTEWHNRRIHNQGSDVPGRR
ncbi:MAG TPA: hypothetical protein PK992_16990, partial [Planctomycetaceae bacterium]|nr:hypothetical protein [Planctomycetaceae bacterium]